jgi:hypothetical protein
MFLNSKIDTLHEEIARLKKNSRNSSEPSSNDIVKPKKGKMSREKQKRKTSGQKSHPKHERVPLAPEDIDRTCGLRRRYRRAATRITADSIPTTSADKAATFAVLSTKGYGNSSKAPISETAEQRRRPESAVSSPLSKMRKSYAIAAYATTYSCLSIRLPPVRDGIIA